jgi:hypothetical protein
MRASCGVLATDRLHRRKEIDILQRKDGSVRPYHRIGQIFHTNVKGEDTVCHDSESSFRGFKWSGIREEGKKGRKLL